MEANDKIQIKNDRPFRILSLDGGGAKGFYTLGLLKQIEAINGGLLCDRFDLIFGTSTGAIIAALLGLGYRVDEIHALYRTYVPAIMSCHTASGKTAALKELATKVFGDRDFSCFKTDVGIVATQWDFEKPKIFKTNRAQAHGRLDTFIPGFGKKISEAVQASCSAFPFFKRVRLKLDNEQAVELADGGYCANNPTLYAIADGIKLESSRANLRVVSLGVGVYPEPKYVFYKSWIRKFPAVRLLQKTLDINTNSMEQLRKILFKDVPTIRISETFSRPEMATDLMEHNLAKLDQLYQRGGESFAQHEEEVRKYLT